MSLRVTKSVRFRLCTFAMDRDDLENVIESTFSKDLDEVDCEHCTDEEREELELRKRKQVERKQKLSADQLKKQLDDF